MKEARRTTGVYRMSESGNCPRVLAAPKLGYEPIPESESQIKLLKHASRHEQVVADALSDEGYTLLDAGLCLDCLKEFGEKRYGFHVEIITFLIRLIGHIDRLIVVNGSSYPLEIKSLGRFTFEKFKRERFGYSPSYAGQEACYLEAIKRPGFYAVQNRDTGELLKYSIPRNGKFIELEGFERLEIPITYEQVESKLHLVELGVQNQDLPQTAFDEKSNECRWCRVRYLCSKEDKEEKAKDLNLPTLLEAAELYKEGKQFERMAEERVEQARQVFITHAKEQGLEKYRVQNLSISYRGQKTKKWLDEKTIRSLVSPEIVKQAEKESKPYDDYSIRILGGENT